MLMLTAYMDETGHSKDEKQKFNGMAGLITLAENWEYFERKWEKTLDEFHIPYIHMKENETMFAGWPEDKLKELSAELWKVIKDSKALPIGSIIPMDDFRPLENKMRLYYGDPYFIAMQDCIKAAGIPALPNPSAVDVRIAIVFSEQVEFKYQAQALFDAIMKQGTPPTMRRKFDPPTFRDMRDFLPLQAADMVAYEVYKEYERVYYHLPRKRRWGYERLEELYEGKEILKSTITRHSAATITDMVRVGIMIDAIETTGQRKRHPRHETKRRIR